jgi:hypothetical protein
MLRWHENVAQGIVISGMPRVSRIFASLLADYSHQHLNSYSVLRTMFYFMNNNQVVSRCTYNHADSVPYDIGKSDTES